MDKRKISNGVKPFVVRPVLRLEGAISLAGDKSIAHRAVIISSISPSSTRIENFPTNQDCLSTQKALQKLGIKITCQRPKGCKEPSAVITINGRGLAGLLRPKGAISAGDSGTTLRLLLGLLAGQDFKTRFIAGESLSRRPMLRVTAPLRLMGAKISAKCKMQNAKLEEYPPITIKGGNLKAITYKMPVSSAQVKSAILLASLYAQGETRVIEPISTRDHTERMLKLFKAKIKVEGNSVVIKGKSALVSPKKIYIPGDISSAAFFIVAATLIANSKIVIRNVGLNPLRLGAIKVLKRMGADIKIKNEKLKMKNFEPSGDLIVKNSLLKGTIVKKEEIPSLIDELPILMVAAAYARGRTVFEGVGELRLKETDRIRSMLRGLKKMGSEIKVSKNKRSEKIIIRGVKQLKGARVRSFGDHRTAMSMIVAGLAARGSTQIDDISCINKSLPNFLSLLKKLTK